MTTASLSSAASHLWFPIDYCLKDASISFKLYRRANHHKIHVKVDKGGNRQNVD